MLIFCFAFAIGLLFLFSGITGRLLPLKRHAGDEGPPQVYRAIYIASGTILTAIGIAFLFVGHKN